MFTRDRPLGTQNSTVLLAQEPPYNSLPFSMWPLFFLIPVTPGLCCSSNMAVCISLKAVHSQPFLSSAVTLPAPTQSWFPQGTWHHLSVSGFSHWNWAKSVVGLCPHYSEFREDATNGRHVSTFTLESKPKGMRVVLPSQCITGLILT